MRNPTCCFICGSSLAKYTVASPDDRAPSATAAPDFSSSPLPLMKPRTISKRFLYWLVPIRRPISPMLNKATLFWSIVDLGPLRIAVRLLIVWSESSLLPFLVRLATHLAIFDWILFPTSGLPAEVWLLKLRSVDMLIVAPKCGNLRMKLTGWKTLLKMNLHLYAFWAHSSWIMGCKAWDRQNSWREKPSLLANRGHWQDSKLCIKFWCWIDLLACSNNVSVMLREVTPGIWEPQMVTRNSWSTFIAVACTNSRGISHVCHCNYVKHSRIQWIWG